MTKIIKMLIDSAMIIFICVCINTWAGYVIINETTPVYTGVEGVGGIIEENNLSILFEDGSCLFLDKYYKLVDFVEIQEFLKNDSTNDFNYVDNDFDCDDFAMRLLGNFKTPEWSNYAIGLVIFETDESKHMTVLFVDTNKDIWIIDNNNKIRKQPNDWIMDFVMM